MFETKHLLLLAPLAATAFADLELDRDDVPPPCRDLCQPIVDLTRRCDVDDLPGRNGDRDEDLLQRQCVCTNDSFDVENVAGLCASCFQQNYRTNDNGNDTDDDDDESDYDDGDIQEIMRDCGFSSVSYSSQLSTAAQSVTVEATAPTATDQLTTTIERGNNNNSNNGGSRTSNSGGAQETGDSNDNNDTNDDNNNDSNDQSSSDNNDEDGFAIPGAVPLGGLSGSTVLGLFGAVAGGIAML